MGECAQCEIYPLLTMDYLNEILCPVTDVTYFSDYFRVFSTDFMLTGKNRIPVLGAGMQRNTLKDYRGLYYRS